MNGFIKDFKKIANIYLPFKKRDYVYLIKNFILFTLSFIFFTSLIVLGYLSYHDTNIVINDKLNDPNKPVDINEWGYLNEVPIGLKTIRGVFDMNIAVCLFLFVLSCKKMYNFYHNEKKLAYLYFFSFIPLVSIAGFIYSFKYFSKMEFFKELRFLFGHDEICAREFAWGTKKRYLVLAEWIIYFPTIVFITYNTGSSNQWGVEWTESYFFSNVYYFTVQSNFLCFLFLTVLLFFPQWRIFRNNAFLIACTTYIIIVGGVWLFVLLPTFISHNNIMYWSQYYYASTIYLHIVNPISFFIMSMILILKSRRVSNEFNRMSIIYIAMYPFFYTIFVAILPFNTGASVYGWITNLNPKLAVFVNMDNNLEMYQFGEWYFIFAFFGVNMLIAIIAYLLMFLSYTTNLKRIALINYEKERKIKR